jgi:hypothetical protein
LKRSKNTSKYTLKIFLFFSPSVGPSASVPYFFTIFQPTIFKFWILRENYLSTRRTAGIFDPNPKSSRIELRLGPPHPYISSISEKQAMFFNWYHKVIVKIQIFQKISRKTSIQLLLEAHQQHKKYAQTTPLGDGVSSLLHIETKNSKHHRTVMFLDSLDLLFSRLRQKLCVNLTPHSQKILCSVFSYENNTQKPRVSLYEQCIKRCV